MNPFKVFLLIAATFITVTVFQKCATDPSISGTVAYLPYATLAGVLGLLIFFRKNLVKWLKAAPILLLVLATSCNFVASDKIGVWVDNFGKSTEDYSLVMGKFPTNWWFTPQTWSLEYPATNFPVPIDPIQMYCKDGVGVFVDPSILCALIRSNEACRKYAFQFTAYQDGAAFQEAIEQTVFKEAVESCRFIVQNTVSDSLLGNRGRYYTLMEDHLAAKLDNVYGIALKQFSVEISVDPTLQQAINGRLNEQEKTKKTLASIENERAEIELMKLRKLKIDLESQAYSPQFLRKLELDYSYNAWIALSQSPNKAFVGGTPMNFLTNH